MNSANGNNQRRLHVLARVLRTLSVIWASPGTLVGLVIGTVGLASGGTWQLHSGVLEFYGGFVTRFLGMMPVRAAAMTFGHVVLGQTSESLEFTRTHERVHVKQYERWGPFFIPAYLLFSAALWIAGRDAYRDNPFEVEAYAKS